MLSVSYAECRYAECRYAECGYAECRGAVYRAGINKTSHLHFRQTRAKP